MVTDVEFLAISGPDGLRQLGELLDRAFKVPAGTHFLEDFPVWTEWPGAENSVHRFGAFQSGRLIASTCARVTVMKSTAKSVRIGIIGGVATEEIARGQGLATRLVGDAVKWLESQKVALAVLWGSEHEFYARFGFALSGEQVLVPLSAVSLPDSLAKAGQGWNPALFPLLKERQLGVQYQDADLEWLKKHRHVRWYWSGPVERPTAYAALGKGIDLHDIVHEWGGEAQPLRELLRQIRDDHPSASLLGPPALMAKILPAVRLPPSEFLGLVRVFDSAQLRGVPIWFWGLDGA